MCVQTSIPCCASQGFIILEWYVSTRFRILITLCKPEINNIDHMLILSRPDKEVIRLYVSVQKTILMHEFDSLKLQTSFV